MVDGLSAEAIRGCLVEFPNPYQENPTGAKPVPGIVSLQIATFIEGFLKMWGITLYQHEHEGLAHVIQALMRAFPRIGELWVGDKK